MNRLQDKVALVFGAGSSGPGWSNGKAAAVAYAREGAHVVAVDRVEQAARETVECISAEHHEALAVEADVADTRAISAAVEQAIQVFGRIDILHNNVGTTVMGGPVELDEERWRQSLDVNVGSVYRTCKAVLPHMIRQSRGVIINISSLAAIRWTGYPYFAYYAGKAAVNQATVALAMQYARHGIRANAILPGAIDTPLIYREISSQYGSIEEMRAARTHGKDGHGLGYCPRRRFPRIRRSLLHHRRVLACRWRSELRHGRRRSWRSALNRGFEEGTPALQPASQASRNQGVPRCRRGRLAEIRAAAGTAAPTAINS
jgi:NAD(P)-dependent dehydrogenase (short-subunit alcohol dehydrogenase family)